MPLGITVAGESRPAHTAGPIEVEPCGGGWVLRSDAVGRDHWGNIGLATQRDPHPVHGGGVSHETALSNALLWAGAAELFMFVEEVGDYLEGALGPCEPDCGCLVDKARELVAAVRGEA